MTNLRTPTTSTDADPRLAEEALINWRWVMAGPNQLPYARAFENWLAQDPAVQPVIQRFLNTSAGTTRWPDIARVAAWSALLRDFSLWAGARDNTEISRMIVSAIALRFLGRPNDPTPGETRLPGNVRTMLMALVCAGSRERRCGEMLPIWADHLWHVDRASTAANDPREMVDFSLRCCRREQNTWAASYFGQVVAMLARQYRDPSAPRVLPEAILLTLAEEAACQVDFRALPQAMARHLSSNGQRASGRSTGLSPEPAALPADCRHLPLPTVPEDHATYGALPGIYSLEGGSRVVRSARCLSAPMAVRESTVGLSPARVDQAFASAFGAHQPCIGTHLIRPALDEPGAGDRPPGSANLFGGGFVSLICDEPSRWRQILRQVIADLTGAEPVFFAADRGGAFDDLRGQFATTRVRLSLPARAIAGQQVLNPTIVVTGLERLRDLGRKARLVRTLQSMARPVPIGEPAFGLAPLRAELVTWIVLTDDPTLFLTTSRELRQPVVWQMTATPDRGEDIEAVRRAVIALGARERWRRRTDAPAPGSPAEDRLRRQLAAGLAQGMAPRAVFNAWRRLLFGREPRREAGR